MAATAPWRFSSKLLSAPLAATTICPLRICGMSEQPEESRTTELVKVGPDVILNWIAGQDQQSLQMPPSATGLECHSKPRMINSEASLGNA